MDPLSALVVATSVVGFLDFGAKLVSRYFEIKSSVKGQPAKVAELDKAARELFDIASKAHDNVSALVSNYPKHTESLSRLLNECNAANTKLRVSLDKLTVVPSEKWTRKGASLVVAIRSVWTEDEIDEWTHRVERIRNQMMMNVLMCVWDEAKKTREQTEHVGEGVSYLVETVHRMEATMNKLPDDFEKISSGHSLPDWEGQERMADALWATSGLIDSGLPYLEPPPPPPTPEGSVVAKEPTSRPTANQIAKKVLKSLSFEGMTDRGERIPTAYPETFSWLFGGENSNQPVAVRAEQFVQWLQSENNDVFWITGKPASGKSTLMKFTSTHSSLQSHLQMWSGRYRPIVATFYFWGPGSKDQRSRVGLLRSLLYQLLTQRQDLCNVVAPRRRIFFDLAGINVESPKWDWTELRECLLRFADKVRDEGRLALFVDGLDEYDGDQEELVAFLKQLHRDYHPKLCVASRPENIFKDGFCDSPSLKMEDLTKVDIDIYIEGRLGRNRALQDLRRLEPENVVKLLEDIRERAGGVFLWVVLVVEQLLPILRDNPRLAAIWEAFNALPPDLEKLYDRIQSSIDSKQQQMASKLYQLVMEWKRLWNGQIEAIFLWLASNCENPEKEVAYPERQREHHVTPLMTRLLAGHTKGILQVSESPESLKPRTVDFLHRTAFDWLRMERNWNTIRSQEPPGFQAILTHITVLISHLRTLEDRSKDSPRRQELRKQLVFRILEFSGKIENTSENKAKMVTILSQMETDSLLPVDIKSIFKKTRVQCSNRKIENELVTLAAAWSCLPYLEAKTQLNPNILHTKHKGILTKHFSKESILISLLEAAALGGVSRKPLKYSTIEWFDEARTFSQWRASQRLDTIKFLLEHDVKPDSRLKDMVKKFCGETKNDIDIGYENQYWTLVGKMFDLRPGNLAEFDNMKRELLPEIKESRRIEEFPEFDILIDRNEIDPSILGSSPPSHHHPDRNTMPTTSSRSLTSIQGSFPSSTITLSAEKKNLLLFRGLAALDEEEDATFVRPGHTKEALPGLGILTEGSQDEMV